MLHFADARRLNERGNKQRTKINSQKKSWSIWILWHSFWKAHLLVIAARRVNCFVASKWKRGYSDSMSHGEDGREDKHITILFNEVFFVPISPWLWVRGSHPNCQNENNREYFARFLIDWLADSHAQHFHTAFLFPSPPCTYFNFLSMNCQID